MPSENETTYIGLFLEEASEQLSLLENAILNLEHEASEEVLKEIFRAAHTLKGAARAMNFDGIGELTHAMEDTFDLLRAGKLAVSTELIDGLLIALDQLKHSKEEIAHTGESKIDMTETTERLRIMQGVRPGQTQARRQAPKQDQAQTAFQHDTPGATVRLAVHEACRCGLKAYEVTVAIAHDCAMRSVRAMLVLQAMERIGSVLFTTPDDVALENEEFDFVFGILLATEEDTDVIRDTAQSVAEIENVVISEAEDIYADESEPELPMIAQLTDEQHEVSEPETDVAPAEESLKPAARTVAAVTQTVRVDVTRLDNLLNLVGELVIDQTRLAQIAVRMRSENHLDEQLDYLRDAAGHLGRITAEMQEEIMKARMLPLDNLFARFPRMVRDLAHKLNKDIEFTVSGQETELDRSVIEVIGDPLIHLLRNCVDHGIEVPADRISAGKPARGSVAIGARHQESHIVIEIEDDGRGIDPNRIRSKAVTTGLMTLDAAGRLTDKEALSLIFSAGFSTADEVTDVSGRGVGMDIVRNNLTRFGAILDIDSRVGQGTRFTIKLPLTLAIIRGLLVSAADGVYVLPLASVIEAMQLDNSKTHRINHREVVLTRGAPLPLVRLNDLFGAAKSDDPEEVRIIALKRAEINTEHIVVVGAGSDRIGVVVDSLLGEQEIVIKSLSKHVGDATGISGATILGDGRIALIVDVNGLLAIATDMCERKVETYAA